MYNVIVADDDRAIRKGLMKVVYSFFQKRKAAVYEARNGLEAFRLLTASAVDIIIVDIKMPVCDGLELIRRIKAAGLKTKIIVLSGFNDYQLVRTALVSGASDYLLKPLDMQAITAQLDKLVKTIDAERADSQTSAQVLRSDGIEQQILMEYLLKLPGAGSDSAEPLLKKYNIQPDDPSLLWVIDFGENRFGEKVADTVRVARELEHAIARFPAVVLQGTFDQFSALLVVAKSRSDGLLRCAGDCFSKQKAGSWPGLCPLQYTPLCDLKSYSQICDNMLSRCFYDLPVSGEAPGDYEPHMEAALEHAAAGEEEPFVQEMDRVFSGAACARPPVNQFRYQLSNWVHRLMIKNNMYISVIGSHPFSDDSIINVIETSKQLKSLRDAFVSIVCRYMAEIRREAAQNDDLTIAKAKKYIAKNYQNNLMLSDVAKVLCLSPNYFSAVFKSRTGTTFRDYLVNLRVEKAKELMRDTNLKIYEISCRVGYPETAHFTRAFKKVTGMSPADYKKHMG